MKVSVIIPAYNVGSYIGTTLRSLQAQTMADLEVLVVDDASRDDTAMVASRLAANDPRIRLISQPRNGGVCRARNAALEVARGQWLAIVDGDDALEPERLARMVEAAESLDVDWLADDQAIVRDLAGPRIGRVFRNEPSGARAIEPAHLVRSDPPERIGYGTLKPIVRRSHVERHGIRYRLGLERFEDFVFHIDCAAAGGKLALLNEPLYRYLLRPGSLTAIDPLPTLEGMRRQNAAALEAVRRGTDQELVRALEGRGRQIERSIGYRRVLRDAARADLAGIARTLVRQPAVALTTASRLTAAAGRRLGRARIRHAG